MTSKGVDSLVRAVRERIEVEGLRPFALRSGIPLGQLRSVVQGRASRYTTLEAIASALGMRLFVGPVKGGGAEGPRLPEEITRALDLPSNASVDDAVGRIDRDAMESRLRDGMRAARDLTQRAAAAAELVSRLVEEASTTRMMPFAEHVRFRRDTGEVEFEESADLSIAVAERALPAWARANRLTCVRAAGDAMEPTIHDGDLVVVDRNQRVAVDGQLFVVRVGKKVVVKRLRRIGGGWNLVSDNRAHPPTRMDPDDAIAGRVAWHGPRGDAVA